MQADHYRVAVDSKTKVMDIYFSYSQFMVYDLSEQWPQCMWSEDHTSQGFARREKTVCIGTMLEFGDAKLSLVKSGYLAKAHHQRVFAVPFECASGAINVVGPEEFHVERHTYLPVGSYRLTVAQTVVDEGHEDVELFFEQLSTPLLCSEIILADELIAPPSILSETADRCVDSL